MTFGCICNLFNTNNERNNSNEQDENLDDNWDSEMIEIWSEFQEPLIFRTSPEIGMNSPCQ